MKIQVLIELDLRHECLLEEVSEVEEIMANNYVHRSIAEFTLSFAENDVPRPGLVILPLTETGKIEGNQIGTITFTSSE